MMRQQWLVFLPMTLASAGLAACASMMGGEQVQVRPVDSRAAQAPVQHDPIYESAVSAINERDYGRALDYLQAAKAKDPGNIKILNALGVVYDKLGRFDLSARYYAQARNIEPDSKIVAENMGYSRVLQRLMNPGAAVAVATLDLPPSLPAPAAPEQKSAILAATVPATIAPLPDANTRAASSTVPQLVQLIAENSVSATPPPEARQIAAPSLALAGRLLTPASLASAPVLPPPPLQPRQIAVPASVIASSSQLALTTASVPDLPLPPPESRQVAVPASVIASAGHPALTSASLPDLPLLPPEARQVAVPASVSATTGQRVMMTASLPDLPVAPPEVRRVSVPVSIFAAVGQQIVMSESVPELPLPPPEARPVAISSTIFASASQPSLTAAAMPSLPTEAPAEAKAIIAPSGLAVPAMPVMATPERLAVAESPPTVVPAAIPVEGMMVGMPASIATPPATRLSHASVVAPHAAPENAIPANTATPPAEPLTQHKQILAAIAAVPPVHAKPAATGVLPAVEKLAEAPPRLEPIKPVRMTVASPMARPVSPATPAVFSGARPVPIVAKLTEKRTDIATPQPAVSPAKPYSLRAVFLALVALPARFFTPAAAKQAVPAVQTAMKADSVRFASVKMAVAQTAPAKPAAIELAAPMAPAANESARKILTIGQPVQLLNASGKPSGTGTVLRRLATLGWTMRASDARAQPASVLFYSAQNFAAAKALQRTLPFPVRLTVDKADGSGMRLVIGRDYLSWKPRNPRIAALWQKGAVIASLQKPAIKGVR